jgi:hypothetical protein
MRKKKHMAMKLLSMSLCDSDDASSHHYKGGEWLTKVKGRWCQRVVAPPHLMLHPLLATKS